MGAYGQLVTFGVKMCRLNRVFDGRIRSTCNFLCVFLCCFDVFFLCCFCFHFIKIFKFALPGVMLMYERTSIDGKKDRRKKETCAD